MSFDPNYTPRLVDLKRLGPAEEAATGLEGALEARRRGPRVTAPETLSERKGYTTEFLGDFAVSWPRLVGERARDVLPTSGRYPDRLDYQHFSVTMSRERRMAIFVGVNIDGSRSVSIERGADKWSLDGRIGIDQQIGEDLYAENLLDRGHLVRREDPNWGDDAETANEDTFHFTNCAPQMAGFNQQTWLSLEKYILDNTRRWAERVTVFSGPIFRDDDRLYRGVLIPTAFWKVVAFLGDDGKPSATAYMIDQKRELGSLEAAFGKFKTYQRSVRQIELLTDIDFGPLSRYDGFSNEERATGTRIEAELTSPADIRV
ncbi:DNA/RNA non-specific endonuclease [Novosphingobium sp. YJ-S2-02]|uniref:DNA/RNA non-specific endonuclease n=1 Tax=Novosphingobium aureum TaxID=2792964 RepID=A0A931MJP0_9SPHN|nr:DNA/RNA non-specific endonuclease [Novosphingobium aureum]MBH0111624.1 DNA/RNA non-specific endonuclease [Novosphingobium aureum]